MNFISLKCFLLKIILIAMHNIFRNISITHVQYCVLGCIVGGTFTEILKLSKNILHLLHTLSGISIHKKKSKHTILFTLKVNLNP